MIIQAYTSEPEIGEYATFWDNAVQVKHYRQDQEDYHQRSVNLNYHPLFRQQCRNDQYKETNTRLNVVQWIDRETGEGHKLASIDSVFVLNDEGKTLVRV